MKKLLLLLFLFSHFSHAQIVLSGKLLDSLTKTPVAFANIGIVSKAIGTTSNENGTYILVVPDSLIDEKVKFSIIGYKSKSIHVKELTLMQTIVLEQATVKLKEITVYSKKPLTKIIGNKTTSESIMAGFVTNTLGSEMGIELDIKEKNTKIKKIFFNIVTNPFDSVIFRLNIYTLHANGSPSENLLKKNIITPPISKTGLVEIDIDEQNIFTSENVLISIEWIKDFGDNSGLYFSSKLLKNKTQYRKASQDSWTRVNRISVGLWAEVEY